MSPRPQTQLATEDYSTVKNRALQLNSVLKNLGLLRSTELLISLVPAEYFVDTNNNGLRMAPFFSSVTIGGAEIYQGNLSSYFQSY